MGVELLFDGDANANATATLEFRASGATSWRSALPLWRTEDRTSAPGPAFYGSALLLEPGTTYDTRVTVSDPDGVDGESVLSASIETRPDDIADVATLRPSLYVSPDGNDANDGTSPTRAWRTLDTTLATAPPGAVVDVAPGNYVAPSEKALRTKPLTLKARNPAAESRVQTTGGEQRTVAIEASAGAHSVVEPRGSDGAPAVSAPAGAGDADLVGQAVNRLAPWQQVTLQGVVDPTQTFGVWKWTGSPIDRASELGFAGSRADQPRRVANWTSATPELDTPQKWAEQVFSNPDWQSGFWAAQKAGTHFTDENGQDATTNVADVYVRLPGDVNPNNFYITLSSGTQNGLGIDGDGVRISGLEFRLPARGVLLGPHATRAIIEHCVFQVGLAGLWVVGERGKDGAPSTYGSDHVVQDNVFRDNGQTTGDSFAGPAIPWLFIKLRPKIAGTSETTGIGGTGGARRMVVRGNTFEGTFDGFGGYHVGFDRYSMQDADVYDNLFRRQGDDGVDLARGTINNRIWGNRFELVHDVFSIVGPTWGPVYFFRNQAWRFGNELNGRNAAGLAPAGQAIKYGSVDTGEQAARVFIVANTWWSDQVDSLRSEGIVQYGQAGPDVPYLYVRNNILRVADKAVRFDVADRWDEDGDDFSSSNPNQPAVMQTAAGAFRADVAAYRASSGQGGHTNTRAAFGDVPDEELMDPTNGDLQLKPGSSLVDRGVLVANIAYQPGKDFDGAAPDPGAVEYKPRT